MNIATQAAQIGLEWDTRTGAVTVPIYQTATFRHPGLGASTGYDYTRSGNPTRQGVGVLASFQSQAELRGNQLRTNPEPMGAVINSQIMATH